LLAARHDLQGLPKHGRRQGRHRFAAPKGCVRSGRGAVLHVLYLIFNEGYATSSGPAHQRRLVTDAMTRGAVLNQAVAVAMAQGPAEGLALLEKLDREAPLEPERAR
jgi:predicted RNA polymerase sigma factor